MKKILGTILGFILLCGMMLFTASCQKEHVHTPVTDAAVPATDTEDGLTEGSHCADCGEVLKAQEKIPATLQGTDVRSKAMMLDGDKLSVSLSNTTEIFSFPEDITVANEANYIVATDINCSNTIASKTVELEIGNNVFYLLVSNGDDRKLYTANIRRRPIYTVSFEISDGTAIETQNIEEGGCAEIPKSPKLGYVFTEWEHDFSQPIIGDITVKANFGIDEKMQDFEFTSTASTCTITGVKDKNVSEISIPDYVTDIGEKSFYNCTKLTAVTIGNSITSISDQIFINCHMLSNVTIGDSVTSIDNGAFRYAVLTNINVSEKNTAYTSISGDLYSKDGKALIQYAIGKTATQFAVPDSVTSISDYAFAYCNSLSQVTIPDSVTSIGDNAFYECYSLIHVTIPDSVVSIGRYTFNYCTELTTVTIGAGVTDIGEGAFFDCGNLISITVSERNTAYKSIAGNLYTKDVKTLIQYATGKTATHFTIPDGVTSIGDRAFCGCDALKGVTIPESVTVIGSYAFDHCREITGVTIPNSVTSIGEWAFSWCNNLIDITIPDSVISIGQNAFRYSNLIRLTFRVTEGWWMGETANDTNGASVSATDLADPYTAAEYLNYTYCRYYWYREV